jgi:hypothetical protein
MRARTANGTPPEPVHASHRTGRLEHPRTHRLGQK